MWHHLKVAVSVDALNCFSSGDGVECVCSVPGHWQWWDLVGSGSQDALSWVSLLGLLHLTVTFYTLFL